MNTMDEHSMDSGVEGSVTQPTQEVHEHHHGTKGIVWSVVVLVVLIGLAGVIAHFAGVDFGTSTEDIGDGRILTRASDGAIVGNFPQELLLDDTTRVVVESYTIEHTQSGDEQLVVAYTSDLNMGEIANAYVAHLQSLGWALVQVGDVSSTGQASAYFRIAGADVNLTFAENNSSVMVTVSYLKRAEEILPSDVFEQSIEG